MKANHRYSIEIKVGDVYGNWTILNYAGIHEVYKSRLVDAQCLCGYIAYEIRFSALPIQKKYCIKCNPRQASYKHYKYGTKIYNLYYKMLQLCNNPNYEKYDCYGGRGIRIWKEWDTFEKFYSDIGDPVSDDLCFSRIDKDGDYEPGNVEWIQRSELKKGKGKL